MEDYYFMTSLCSVGSRFKIYMWKLKIFFPLHSGKLSIKAWKRRTCWLHFNLIYKFDIWKRDRYEIFCIYIFLWIQDCWMYPPWIIQLRRLCFMNFWNSLTLYWTFQKNWLIFTHFSPHLSLRSLTNPDEKRTLKTCKLFLLPNLLLIDQVKAYIIKTLVMCLILPLSHWKLSAIAVPWSIMRREKLKNFSALVTFYRLHGSLLHKESKFTLGYSKSRFLAQ